jgi:hypothetical protein
MRELVAADPDCDQARNLGYRAREECLHGGESGIERRLGHCDDWEEGEQVNKPVRIRRRLDLGAGCRRQLGLSVTIIGTSSGPG